MKKKGKLTADEVKHIARLAKLSLTQEEVLKYEKQLDETLDYVENLKKLDTERVTTTSHTVNSANVFFEDGEKNTRGFSPDLTLSNAKNKKNGFFVVKRIM